MTPHSPTAPAAYADAGIGNDDHAIAIGADSSATAGVGNNDLATAFGGGDATAGLFHSTAFADGTNSNAFAKASKPPRLPPAATPRLKPTTSATSPPSSTLAALSTRPLPAAVAVSTMTSPRFSALAAPPWPGLAADWDLAAVFGDFLHASATGANFLFDIQP